MVRGIWGRVHVLGKSGQCQGGVARVSYRVSERRHDSLSGGKSAFRCAAVIVRNL